MHHAINVRPGSCRRRRLLRRPFWVPALLVLVLIAAGGCEKREAPAPAKEQKPAEVAVVTVQPHDVPANVEFIAQVQSSRQVNIQARVSGFLEKRTYTEGAIVKEGDTLFVMDKKPFKVQLDQAKASLSRQQAAFEVARLNLARVKPLTAANALSQKDLDDATGQYQSAAAAVEQAKATVEQAKLNLSYTVITAPVDGITAEALQADGTYLNPANSQLTTVTVLSPAYVNFSLSENDRLRFRRQVEEGLLIEPPGKEYMVEIVLSDGSIYPHTGKVTFAEPSFNAQTGTFMIRATVDNPDGLLRPNQYVRARVKGAIRPNAILVPQRAVRQSSKGHFVWVAADGQADMRPVVTGEWVGDNWDIYEGLHAGDQVVVDGGLTLRPGTAVKTHPWVDPKAAATAPAAGSAPAAGGQ